MLILDFLHAPTSVPLLSICGLTLCVRGSLEGIKSGFDNIAILAHSKDLPLIQDSLHTDSRLTKVKLFSSKTELNNSFTDKSESENNEITLVAADHVWTGNVLSHLFDMTLTGTGAVVKDHHDNIVMAKVEQSHFANFPENLLSVPDQISQISTKTQFCRIRSLEDVKHGEKILLSGLVKDADGIISRNINRKISLFFTRRLARGSTTPNQVTAVVFSLGICSGPAIIAIGGYWGFFAGALLYYLSAIVDGCDGELSRLKFLGTPLGAWLDTVVDDTVGLSYLIGLYLALQLQTPFWGWIGLTTIFFYFLTLVPRYYTLAMYLGTGDYQKLAASKLRPKKLTGFTRIIYILEDIICRIDFIAFAAFFMALCNLSYIFALFFAIGSVGSAIDSVKTFIHFRKDFIAKST